MTPELLDSCEDRRRNQQHETAEDGIGNQRLKRRFRVSSTAAGLKPNGPGALL